MVSMKTPTEISKAAKSPFIICVFIVAILASLIDIFFKRADGISFRLCQVRRCSSAFLFSAIPACHLIPATASVQDLIRQSYIQTTYQSACTREHEMLQTGCKRSFHPASATRPHNP
jgi:hypothetical protein